MFKNMNSTNKPCNHVTLGTFPNLSPSVYLPIGLNNNNDDDDVIRGILSAYHSIDVCFTVAIVVWGYGVGVRV